MKHGILGFLDQGRLNTKGSIWGTCTLCSSLYYHKKSGSPRALSFCGVTSRHKTSPWPACWTSSAGG